MKLKIESGGMDRNTKVVNVDTGEVLEGVKEVTWHCEQGCFATVELKLINIPVSVVGYHKLKPHRRRIET